MPLSEDDMDAFQFISSEMFDPSVFEGFNLSPVDGLNNPSGGWNGYSGGG
jgi:hypothetical protein